MANIDRRSIEGMGVLGLDLMERAGQGVYRAVEDILSDVRDKKAVIVCGKGNNGGDGFVVGRLLRENGANPSAFLLGKVGEVKGDALTNLKRAADLDVDIEEVVEPEATRALKDALEDADVVIDGIFGTGIKGEVRGLAAYAIESINSSGKPVVAVDVPSGLDADTGKFEGMCVSAYITVTFGLPKVGHFFYPGRGLCGELRVLDIGVPVATIEQEESFLDLIEPLDVTKIMPVRAPDAHKGDCGRVAVVAGSLGMTGAAALTSTSAVRMGAGLVTLGIPEGLNDIMEVKLTEVMTRPLPQVRKRRCLALRALGQIRRMLKGADCLALGPGISTYRETVELVKRIVSDLQIPAVIDADGLNALSGDPSPLKEAKASIVITPHPGEFRRLTAGKLEDYQVDRIDTARSFACKFNVTVVLKGVPTLVAWPDGSVFVNSSGNAGMATGGSGDVLTGVIAAIIGGGVDPPNAAIAGVYLHGLAGDLAGDVKGDLGLTAGDIVDFLPDATQEVYGILKSNPNPDWGVKMYGRTS